MASPKLEVFFLYDRATGAPLAGQTIGQSGVKFLSYKDDLGANVSQPTITELGSGAYGFLPVFNDPARAIIYTLDTNGVLPAYFTRFMRPEDWNSSSSVPRFLMRAYRTTSPQGFIYWNAMETPDLTATQAPVPSGELTDIIVAYTHNPE